jgi:energy-coupling factor transporter ATP-binding protein EcfA2
MPLTVISAKQRISEPRGAKILLLGPTGVGKTSQLSTLASSTTLFIDLEAGELAVQDVPADTLRAKTWDQCRNLAVYIGGPNPAMPPGAPYSQAHFDRVCAAMGGGNAFDRFRAATSSTRSRSLAACASPGRPSSPKPSWKNPESPTCVLPMACMHAR